jgi:hypothetical protein
MIKAPGNKIGNNRVPNGGGKAITRKACASNLENPVRKPRSKHRPFGRTTAIVGGRLHRSLSSLEENLLGLHTRVRRIIQMTRQEGMAHQPVRVGFNNFGGERFFGHMRPLATYVPVVPIYGPEPEKA